MSYRTISEVPAIDDEAWIDVSENPLFLYDWFLPGIRRPNIEDPEPSLYNADTGVVHILKYLENENGYFVVVMDYETGDQLVKAVLWSRSFQGKSAAEQELYIRFFEPNADVPRRLDAAPTMTFTQRQIADGGLVSTVPDLQGVFDALFVCPSGKVDDGALWGIGDIPTRGATLKGTRFTFWLASAREGFAKFFRFMLDGRICSDDPAQLQGAYLLDELAYGRRFVFVTEDGNTPDDVSEVIAVIMFSKRMYTKDWRDYAEIGDNVDDDMIVPVLYIDRICSNAERAISWEPGDVRFGIALQYLMGLLAQHQGWQWMGLQDATDDIGTGDNYYQRLGWQVIVYEQVVFDAQKDLGRLYNAVYRSVSAPPQQQQRKRQVSPTAVPETGGTSATTTGTTGGSGAPAGEGSASPEGAASPQRKRARIKTVSLSDSDDKEAAAAAAMLIHSHGDVAAAARMFVRRFGF